MAPAHQNDGKGRTTPDADLIGQQATTTQACCNEGVVTEASRPSSGPLDISAVQNTPGPDPRGVDAPACAPQCSDDELDPNAGSNGSNLGAITPQCNTEGKSVAITDSTDDATSNPADLQEDGAASHRDSPARQHGACSAAEKEVASQTSPIPQVSF